MRASVLDLPALTVLSGNTFNHWNYGQYSLRIEALSGGHVNLGALGSIPSGGTGLDHNIVNSASWAAREEKLESAQGVGAGRPRPGDRGPVVHLARRGVRGRSGNGRRASNQGNRGWGRAPKNRSAAVVRSGRSARKLCSTRKAFSFRGVSR